MRHLVCFLFGAFSLLSNSFALGVNEDLQAFKQILNYEIFVAQSVLDLASKEEASEEDFQKTLEQISERSEDHKLWVREYAEKKGMLPEEEEGLLEHVKRVTFLFGALSYGVYSSRVISGYLFMDYFQIRMQLKGVSVASAAKEAGRSVGKEGVKMASEIRPDVAAEKAYKEWNRSFQTRALKFAPLRAAGASFFALFLLGVGAISFMPFVALSPDMSENIYENLPSPSPLKKGEEEALLPKEFVKKYLKGLEESLERIQNLEESSMWDQEIGEDS